MNNLKDIDANEIATIRIALLDKIDNIKTYIQMSNDLQQPISAKYLSLIHI